MPRRLASLVAVADHSMRSLKLRWHTVWHTVKPLRQCSLANGNAQDPKGVVFAQRCDLRLTSLYMNACLHVRLFATANQPRMYYTSTLLKTASSTHASVSSRRLLLAGMTSLLCERKPMGPHWPSVMHIDSIPSVRISDKLW